MVMGDGWRDGRRWRGVGYECGFDCFAFVQWEILCWRGLTLSNPNTRTYKVLATATSRSSSARVVAAEDQSVCCWFLLTSSLDLQFFVVGEVA